LIPLALGDWNAGAPKNDPGLEVWREIFEMVGNAGFDENHVMGGEAAAYRGFYEGAGACRLQNYGASGFSL
jgi:hypothetical protein